MTLATPRHMLVYLGLSASAANDVYQGQGIDSIDEWANFDKDDVVCLIHLVCKPGGGGNGKMDGFKRSLISSLTCSSSITRSVPEGQWILRISIFVQFEL